MKLITFLTNYHLSKNLNYFEKKINPISHLLVISIIVHMCDMLVFAHRNAVELFIQYKK